MMKCTKERPMQKSRSSWAVRTRNYFIIYLYWATVLSLLSTCAAPIPKEDYNNLKQDKAITVLPPLVYINRSNTPFSSPQPPHITTDSNDPEYTSASSSLEESVSSSIIDENQFVFEDYKIHTTDLPSGQIDYCTEGISLFSKARAKWDSLELIKLPALIDSISSKTATRYSMMIYYNAVALTNSQAFLSALATNSDMKSSAFNSNYEILLIDRSNHKVILYRRDHNSGLNPLETKTIDEHIKAVLPELYYH